MFDKTLKVQSTRETLFLKLKCVRAPKQTSKVHFELQARPNDQIHTQYVKMDGLERVFT